MPSSKPLRRLRDIAANIDRILAYTADLTTEEFAADDRTQDAVERCLQRVSEAAVKLGPLAEEAMPRHFWAGIRGIGNVLRHDYDRVDPVILWRIIRHELPPLRQDVLALMAAWQDDAAD